jgi:hypothetical protein
VVPLIVVLIFQQVYWSFLVHGLINKLMSRNYAEYEASKPVKEEKKTKTDHGAPEDLSYLGSIGGLR